MYSCVCDQSDCGSNGQTQKSTIQLNKGQAPKSNQKARQDSKHMNGNPSIQSVCCNPSLSPWKKLDFTQYVTFMLWIVNFNLILWNFMCYGKKSKDEQDRVLYSISHANCAEIIYVDLYVYLLYMFIICFIYVYCSRHPTIWVLSTIYCSDQLYSHTKDGKTSWLDNEYVGVMCFIRMVFMKIVTQYLGEENLCCQGGAFHSII